jgi:hypothetical protein
VTTPDPYAHLTETQRQFLTAADTLVQVACPGVRHYMPPHLRATLQDLLSPLCDDPDRLDTLMHQITNRDDVAPGALWLGLHEQRIDEDTIRRRVRIDTHGDGAGPRDDSDDGNVRHTGRDAELVGDRDYDPTAPIIAQFDDANHALFAALRFEIETAGEYVLHWHDGGAGAWTERFSYVDEALVRLATLITAASSDRPLVDTTTLMTNVRHFLDGQIV